MSTDFYSQFMGREDLVFDIGANVGNKAYTFSEICKTVIACEPQQSCLTALRNRFSRNKQIVIVPAALGASAGFSRIQLHPTESGMASMCPDWIKAATETKRFSPCLSWEGAQEVEVLTLDQLISMYGLPSFIKIDVEGYESQVLSGLTKPVKALSIEFHPEHLTDTLKCVEHLMSLGEVSFNYSLKESMVMASDWVSGRGVMDALWKLTGDNEIYGDVYARFK